MDTTETPTLCACGCGRPKGPAHRGWAPACYFRWYRAGAREGEPPPPPRRGPEWSAALSEEVHWLVSCGESAEQAATRVGVTVETAERYLNPAPPRPACAVRDCHATATYRRWCDTHRDLRAAYEQARAAGKSRKAAAFHVNVHLGTTYEWEPGRPGVGRPRKRAAA